MNSTYDFGMIGLGVMGRNFLLNVADHGFSAAGLDLDPEKARALDEESGDKPVKGTTNTAEFVAMLRRPRKIMLLVPAGKPVDSVIESLLPHLDKGDLIIDGGNSHFEDTNRRTEYMKMKGMQFLGVGVSGGSEGARRGPSIMPGGNLESYQLVGPILEAVSAKVNGAPCVAYLGNTSAGHYTKMVHNGIEYGLMQLIAEAYDILKNIGGLSNQELHEVFSQWNEGALESFLIEITADIFTERDDKGDGWLVDKILDKAKQKGTGKWTSQNAMDLGIGIPTIDAAVTMRGLSALKMERKQAAPHYTRSIEDTPAVNKEQVIIQVGEALHFAFIITYAQGMHLLAEASEEYGYGLDLKTVAKIWRGGCIIRAELLEDMHQAYQEQPALRSLLLSPAFHESLLHSQHAARAILKTAIDFGVPTMALSSALAYFDAYRSERLPLNLVQAQRDYFGSHTYERVDKEGVFHTEW
ncbi:MAG: NADP-dependent phosphogluconate dehydrogenase [Lewinellaceae bacterium]|nr:NADP-dependent phosphogluconate dehydrogenase [Phaeodactylibacter sp.]MCB0612650.1 NADP-dependent phosphogluconate dehydrogenase [Phaeodactylibacter sp.]MCB9348382.1 NADP-dependent phosphogluconate dehydrogenase [Lewinellaceae bacterium]